MDKLRAACLSLMAMGWAKRIPRCLLLGLIVLFGCSSAPTPPQPAKPLRIALRSIVQSLDPLSENTITCGSIYLNIYDPLVRRDRSMQIQPALAVRWSNPDELTWIFELRQGVRFSDGTPMTAVDVKFSLERIKNSAAQQASALAIVERIDVIDDYKIRLVTSHPSSTLLVRMEDLYILPHTMDPGGKGIIPGTGPYMIKSWKPGLYAHLEANPSYWGSPPSIPEARIELFSEAEHAVQAFLRNEVDILPQIDPETIEQYGLMSRKDVTIRSDPGLMVLFLAFQFGSDSLPATSVKGNPFRDRRVRLAVYQAIDVDRIIREVLSSHAIAVDQLVAPLVYGYNTHLERRPHDPKAARELLSEAGYANGFDVRLDTTNNRYRMDVRVGEEIKKDLAAVGIRVQLNSRPFQEWMQIRQSAQSPFYLAGWACASGDASGALDYLLHSRDSAKRYGSANDGRYSNTQLDAAIEESEHALDPRIRLDLLEAAMKQAMEDVAAVPLYVENNLTAAHSNVRWEPFPDQIIRLETIQKE